MIFSELPEDVLIHIIVLSGVKEILKLEQTCRDLRELILSSHHVWLAQLRRLDQAHAPNLPPYVDPRTLKSNELRTLVVKAVQGFENWRNGTFDEDKIVCVELNDPPTIDPPGNLPLFDIREYSAEYFVSAVAPMIKLVPGGRHLFVLWNNGFVQLVDTQTQKAIWTYPDLHSTGDLAMPVEGYNVDFGSDGSATVVISRLSVQRSHEQRRMLTEVFRINIQSQLEISRLYSRRIENIYNENVLDDIVIQGDFIAVSLDQAVFASMPMGCEIPSITIILDHLFLSYKSNNLPKRPLLRVLDIRHLFATLREEHRSSSATATIDLGVFGFTDAHFELPAGLVTDGRIAPPSLCSFHWKEERERFHQITVATYAEDEGASDHSGPYFFRFAFIPRKSDIEAPVLHLLPCANVRPPIKEQYLFYRKRTTLSGRLLINSKHLPFMMHRHMKGLLLATLDDDNVAQRQPFASVPDWLFEQRPFTYDLDYLSGAIICTNTDERWIKIVYPA